MGTLLPIFLTTTRSQRMSDGEEEWNEPFDHTKWIGYVKLLAPKEVAPDNGYDFAGTYRTLAVLPKGVHQDAAMTALAETLRARFTRNCSHSYDCCGCHHALVSVRKTKRKKVLSVQYSIYRNY